MSTEIELIREIVDLKIREAVTVVMSEVGKLAESYNQLSARLGPIAADYDERKRQADAEKDQTIAALERERADLFQRIADLKQIAGIQDDPAQPGTTGVVLLQPRTDNEVERDPRKAPE